ncbi:MAG: L,D-transpeptidase family protein [Gammaproteobacteria bacterium]
MLSMRFFCAFLFLFACASRSGALTLDMPPPGEDVIGEVRTVKIERYEDTLNQYAQAHGVGFRELLAANPGINPWVPGAGREVVIPAQFILPYGERTGIVINLAEMRLFYFHPDGKAVTTYPIGIGREGWQTPLVTTHVTKIVKDPTWYPPASIRAEHAAMGDPLPTAVPPGPDNPLGPWSLRLATPGYLIHGSNKELGVGMRVSHGCMRMYNHDVTALAATVAPGTAVRIINSPVKVGWKAGQMYVEVHDSLEESRAVHVSEAAVADAIHIANRITRSPVPIDWYQAKDAAVKRSGIPVRVSTEQVAVR